MAKKVCLLLLLFCGIAIAQGPANDVTLVCFTASWCPNCPSMKVLWDDAKNRGVNCVVVDIDQQPALKQKWGVQGVPTTFVVYATKDKKVVAHSKVVGITTKEKLNTFIEEARRETK